MLLGISVVVLDEVGFLQDYHFFYYIIRQPKLNLILLTQKYTNTINVGISV